MKKWKSNISERTKIIAIILSVLAAGGLIFCAFVYLLYHIRNYWWIVGLVLYFIGNIGVNPNERTGQILRMGMKIQSLVL